MVIHFGAVGLRKLTSLLISQFVLAVVILIGKQCLSVAATVYENLHDQ